MGENKGKHLDLSKRQMIENGLKQNLTAVKIGLFIGIDPTNISREIKRYRIYKSNNDESSNTICKDCMYKASCNQQNNSIITKCYSYTPLTCHKLDRYPFVCNGCPKKDFCPLDKYLYEAKGAQAHYRYNLVETRKGLNQTADELQKINDAVLNGVEHGQSIYHIANSLDEVKVSTSTLYRYIHNEYLTVQVHNLPKVVTLKKRKKKIPANYNYKENKGLDRTGHLYSDWITFQVKNRIVIYWEMDFLGVNKKSKKVILSLTIPKISFIMLYIIENPNNQKVIDIFNNIENEIGFNNFLALFEAIVTDRDCKFNDVKGFEYDQNERKRTSLFFCNSTMSNQKPNIENINSQLRLYIDKKADISNITQNQCYELSSHLNSRILNSLGTKCPIDTFINIFGEDILSKLHQHKVEPKDVSPKDIIK